MSYFFDNSSVFPQNNTYYSGMYLRPENIVSADGYNFVASSNLGMTFGNLNQNSDGTELIYTNTSGSQFVLAGGTGDTNNATYILQSPNVNLANAQAINSLAHVGVGSVLTVSNASTGVLAASTRILDDTYTSGNHNLFLGNFSGNTTLSGSDNVGAGVGSLQNLTSGSTNVSIGNESMNQCASGGFNTTIGYEALAHMVGGNANVAIGALSGLNYTGGLNNVFIGYSSSGASGTTGGDNNVCIGAATDLSNASQSVTLGYGIQNHCVNSVVAGYQASCTSSGTGNIVVGAGSNITGAATNSIALGTGTSITNSNVCAITSPSTGMALGVNTNSPQSVFDIGTATAAVPSCVHLPVITNPSAPSSGVFLFCGADNQLRIMGVDGTARVINTTP
jgi:trimeric autotransporter adhesin